MKSDNILYHYTDFNAMRGIITNGEIWLWNLRRMNDSQEMQYFITQLKTLIKKDLPEKYFQKADLLFEKNLKDFTKLSSYAACFSEYSDDAAQWARYGKNGMGVCIAFDKQLLDKIGNESHTPLCKVNYSADIDELEIVSELQNMIMDEKTDEEKVVHIFNNLINSSPLFKHPSFISEKEYRLITLPNTVNEYLGDPHFFIEETNIKKYYVLNLKNVCNRLNIKYSDLFMQICIGPQARVTKEVLSDYFTSIGMDELNGKIKMSECPLRRF